MRVTGASLSYRFVSDRFHLASSPRRERGELSRSSPHLFVSFVKISQYTTVTIDFSEYFHYFYCTPLLEQITENALGQSVIYSNIINPTYVIIKEKN